MATNQATAIHKLKNPFKVNMRIPYRLLEKLLLQLWIDLTEGFDNISSNPRVS